MVFFLWQWMKPSWILEFTFKQLRSFSFIYLSIFFFICLFFSYQIVGDVQQEDNFKIFYIHVPCAWFAIFIYCCMVIFSLGFLITSLKFYDILTSLLAKIGFAFSCFTLVTGSLWGACTWGTLWAWDTRLTSTLILCIFYLFYLVIHLFFEKSFRNSFFLSFLVLLGFLNIPILKFSVDWWNTLHQKQSITSFALFVDYSVVMSLFFFLLFYFIYVLLYFFLEFRIVLIREKVEQLYKYINAYD